MKKKTPIQKARKKADSLVTPVTRALYGNVCCICGNTKNITGHHYHPKSIKGYLRYNEDNFVPLCYYCHIFKIHNMADPETIDKMREWMGDKVQILKDIKRPIGTYMDLEYYTKAIEHMNSILIEEFNKKEELL